SWRKADLWRMRRLYGARRLSDRRRRAQTADGRAAAAGDKLFRPPAPPWLSRGDPTGRRLSRTGRQPFSRARISLRDNRAAKRRLSAAVGDGCGWRRSRGLRITAGLGLWVFHPPYRYPQRAISALRSSIKPNLYLVTDQPHRVGLQILGC